MGKIITLCIIMLCALSSYAQINPNNKTPDVIRYDFETYKGPIKKGWLFSEESYQKLYISYNAADSLIKSFDKYNSIMLRFDSLSKELPKQYESRLADKDKVIVEQSKNIGEINLLLKQSDQNVKDINKQFITIGKVKIHKGTAIKVGLTMGVVGYLIGKF